MALREERNQPLFVIAPMLVLLAVASVPLHPQLTPLQVSLTHIDAETGVRERVCHDAVIRAEPHGSSTREAKDIRFTSTGLSEPHPGATLSLRAGQWTISLHSTTCWARSKLVAVPDVASVALPVRPLGHVHVLSEVPRGVEPLADVTAKFFFSADDSSGERAPDSEPDGTVLCTRAENADARTCAIPEGSVDLVLNASRVAAQYYWGIGVEGGKTTQLPKWEVRPGASLSGWVKDAASDDLSTTSIVVRRDSSGRAASPREQRRSSRTDLTTTSSKNGFFQVLGLDEGTFTVQATRDEASAGPFRVTLLSGRETLLREPLMLERPVPFEIAIEPPSGPDGRGWRVELAPMDLAPSQYGKVESVGADPDTGRAQFPGVKPGRFALWLKDAKGSSWWFDQLEITRYDPYTFITLDLIEVCGEVTLGNEPIQATVHFGGERGTVRRTTKTDEDGLFTLLIAEDGDWQVDVLSDEPAIKRRLQKVRVKHNPSKGCAPVELELPNTLIRGVVLDEEDEPVSPALVQVAPVSAGSLEPIAQLATTSVDGVFELYGYPEGSVMVSAHVPGKSSDQKVVTLDEDLDAPWVELVLREHLRVRGKLMSPSGQPVPGAKVFARGVDAVIAITNHTTSTVEGTFEMEISPRSPNVILSVLAPGYSLVTRLEQAIESREVIVRLSPLGGNLEFVMPKESYGLSDPQRPVLFNEAGLGLDLWVLRQWAEINGASASLRANTLVLPALEPGRYTGCMIGNAEALALPPGAVPAQGCLSTFVAPGASERLDITGSS